MAELTRRQLFAMGAAAAVAPVLPELPVDIRLPGPYVEPILGFNPVPITGTLKAGDIIETWQGVMRVIGVYPDDEGGPAQYLEMEPHHGQ